MSNEVDLSRDLSRFHYEDTIPERRVIGFRGDKVSDDRPGMEGKERYINIEYKVQTLKPVQVEGEEPVDIRWMSLAEAREMIGTAGA